MSAQSESVEANAVGSLPNAVCSDGVAATNGTVSTDEACFGKARSLQYEEGENPIPSSRSLRRCITLHCTLQEPIVPICTGRTACPKNESVESKKDQLKSLARKIDTMYTSDHGSISGSSDQAETVYNADSSNMVKGDSQKKVKALGQASEVDTVLPVSNGCDEASNHKFIKKEYNCDEVVSSSGWSEKRDEVLSSSGETGDSKERPRRNSLKPSTTTMSTLLDPLDPEAQGRVMKAHWTEALKNVFQRQPGTPWIHSVLADCCFGFVILLNAVYIALESEVGEQGDSQNVNSGWFVAESIFLCIFLIELLLRIQAERKRFVYSAWNVFDAVLVFNGLLDFVTTLLLTGGTGLNFLTFARVLRLLRIMRILRLLRILRFLRELILLIQGILGALKALGWALILLFLIVTMCSLLVTKTLGSIEHDDPEHDQQIQEYFGSFLKSSFTLLTLMTLDEWSNTARWVIFSVSPVHGFLLIVYVLLTHYTLVNLVTGIILENIMRLSKNEEDRQRQADEEARLNLIQRVHKVFKLMDTNGDGELSVDEFMQGLEDPRLFYLFKSIGLKVWEAVELFSLMDVENLGYITIDEFAEGCQRWQGPAQSRDLLAVQYDMHRALGQLERHNAESSENMESPKQLQNGKTSSDLPARIAAIEAAIEAQSAQSSKIEAQNSRMESTLSKILQELTQRPSAGPTKPCVPPPQLPCSSNRSTFCNSDEHRSYQSIEHLTHDLSEEVGELLDTDDLFSDPASPRHVFEA